MALEEGTDNLMRRVTDVDMNIDIGQGLHVGSVAKEKKGLVLDREVEIEGDEEELAPKFLNFIFLLYYLNFFYFLLFFYYFFYYFIIIIFFILLFFFIDFFLFFLLSLSSEAQFVPKIGWRLRAARYLTSTSCSLGTIIK